MPRYEAAGQGNCAVPVDPWHIDHITEPAVDLVHGQVFQVAEFPYCQDHEDTWHQQDGGSLGIAGMD